MSSIVPALAPVVPVRTTLPVSLVTVMFERIADGLLNFASTTKEFSVMPV